VQGLSANAQEGTSSTATESSHGAIAAVVPSKATSKQPVRKGTANTAPSALAQKNSRGAKQLAAAQAQRQAVLAPVPTASSSTSATTSASAGAGAGSSARAAPTTPASSSNSTAPGSSVLNLRQLLRESNEKRKVELQGRSGFPRFRNSSSGQPTGQASQGLKSKGLGSSL
jgi:hypothetical protein